MVRMVGLWELVVAMNAVPSAIDPFFNPEFVAKSGLGMLLAAGLFSVGIPLLVGLGFIYFPGAITRDVLRIQSPTAPDSNAASLLERVSFTTLGVWFAVQGVLDGVHTFSRTYLYRRFVEDQRYPGIGGPVLSPLEFAGLVTAVLQLVIGLWLLLGNRGLANALARLRR
ncbi:MAG TPA: hypothetical protein VLV56_13995 [Burkholderiales bacterium]|nr:hypothetical protein [Burkholderiales bacterium]